jgi:hypothetical protein
LKQCPWFLKCSLTLYTTDGEEIGIPIELHADDADMIDEEEEVAQKINKPNGKYRQKYGAKTKETLAQVVLIATCIYS